MTFPSFGAGEVLTATDMNAVGLWLVKSQTVGTGVSSVTLSSCFNQDFDAYKVTWTGGACSAGFNVRLQLGSATANYTNSLIYNTFAAPAAVVGAALVSTTHWEWAGAGNTTTAFLNCDVLSPFLAENSRMIANWTPPDAAGWSNGILLDTTSHTSLTLTPGIAGTFTGGTVCVYGYKK
jgi:hypothetical protein